jgi:hypothetical protein
MTVPVTVVLVAADGTTLAVTVQLPVSTATYPGKATFPSKTNYPGKS